MRIFRFVLLMMFTASVPAHMGAQLLVEDFFADGGTTQGGDPLDVRWLASGGTFTVVTDDSRTGVAFAFHPNESRLSPWSDPENRELFFFTSFGREGTLGSIRRSAGVQFLNSHLHLASNLHSVSLGDQPGEVAFVVERLSDIQTRVRYRLNQGPWQEALVDAAALPTVNQIHFRFRRATNEPLERFRISAVRVLRTAADLTPRAPQSWWVAPQGNDGSTGESMENAFASIGRALLWARAGDTVWVREGVYRETLQPGQSGTEEEPIRIRAYGSPLQPEPVTVSAFSPLIPGEGGVGTWEQHDGNIWRIQLPANLPLPLGRNLLKVDGTVLKPARWPTATGPVDFDRRNMTEATAGSVDLETRGPQPPYPAHQDNFVDAAYTAAALAAFPENALAGARIDLCTGHNGWHKTGVVTGNSGDIVHFRFRFEFGWNHDLDTPKHADRFAIWGTLAVLDSPGEFFVDVEGINGPQNMLYVWLPDSGTPDGRAWELRSRSITFQAMTQQHIQVENLRFFGGRVQTGADSAQVIFDGVEVQLGAFNTDQLRHDDQVAVLLDGTGHRFLRGWVRDTEGRSIYPRGEGHQVTETVIENSTSHSLSLDRLLHLVATDLLPQHTCGDAVAAWPDRGPQPATVIAPSDAARPVLEDSPVAGLPGVRFDGIGNHLFVNGAAGLGGGSARFVAVYRNPDPGTTRWQRLFSGRANTVGTDWQTGVAGIVHNEDGAPIPHETTRILDLNRQGDYSFEHFTLGRRSLENHEWFRGELAELFVFSGALEGPPREALICYLRRKYNIVQENRAVEIGIAMLFYS
jgi:hypothetical protein